MGSNACRAHWPEALVSGTWAMACELRISRDLDEGRSCDKGMVEYLGRTNRVGDRSFEISSFK